MNYLYVFAAAFLFSSMEVAIKFTGGAFNPVQLNFIRFLVAGILLYPISRKELSKLTYKLVKKDYLHFAFTGFLCIVVSMTFYTCLLYTSPSPRDVEESRMPSSA